MANDELIGKRFNALTVIEEAFYYDKRGRKRKRYKCLCDCGNYTEVFKQALVDETVFSCGCWKSARMMKLEDEFKKVDYPCSACVNPDTCALFRTCKKYRIWFGYKWNETRKMFGVNVDENC